MFAAALVFEKEPLTLSDLPTVANHWLQIVGVLAMFGMVLWLLMGLPFMRRSDRERIPAGQWYLFLISFVLAAICYGIFGTIAVVASTKAVANTTAAGNPVAPPTPGEPWRGYFLTAAGAFALFAVCLPFLYNLRDFRPRRVWALARLSFQEAIRKRVLMALFPLLLFFLFAKWFDIAKPENQLSNYVTSVFGWSTIFLLVIATIIASFSIPTDIKQQTIHTIVTKPVERFEIVLGRFLGFAALMSVVLFVVSTLSLIYVVRGVDPDAAVESLKAREAIYGNLAFEGTSRKEGDSVGREWDYRKYISAEMPGQAPQFAIFSFPNFPAKLGERQQVPCEFTFDIYRTTKGEENKGIRCALVFTSWRFKRGEEDAYRNERAQERAQGKLSEVEIDNKLAEKYGYFEVPSKSITDYHTMTVMVPSALFKNATKTENDDSQLKADLTRRNQPASGVVVRVKCTSPTQYLGMAKYDLYFRGDDPASGHDRLWFAWNFYKASAGLWLRLCLVTGLAVVGSTYLSGVITLLGTGLLYLAGLVIGFIQEVGAGKTPGGGPMEAAFRIIRREHMAAQLEKTTINVTIGWVDEFFRFFLRLIMNIFPDVYTSNLTPSVAAGFNIGADQFLVAAILTVGYLLPWFLLGYYLIKWREIASAS